MIRKNNLKKALRWGMVGGGKGSQIGDSHRDAAARDRNFELVAGAFDINAERGKVFGVEELGLKEERCYADYKEMFAREAQRVDGIQAVSIATPNSTHYVIAKLALEHDLHVICEKPLSFTSAESEELKAIAEKRNRVFGVMYGYTGYPTIAQACEMVKRGDLGKIRIVHMQFAHGYHAEDVEKNDPALAWRVTPEASGPSYILGDVGTHCLQMGQLISGLEMESLSCMRKSFVESRQLEDDAHVMIKYKNGAVGTLWASGVAIGNTHSFKVEVIGEKGTLRWWDEHPNQIEYASLGGQFRLLDRGMGYLYDVARFERVGGGHPEGYFDSWANLYRNFALAMDAANRDAQQELAEIWYPGVDDGIEGVRFVERCVESAKKDSAWVTL